MVIGFAVGLLLVWTAHINGFLKQDDTDGFFIVGLISLVVGIAILIAQKLDDKSKNNIDG